MIRFREKTERSQKEDHVKFCFSERITKPVEEYIDYLIEEVKAATRKDILKFYEANMKREKKNISKKR